MQKELLHFPRVSTEIEGIQFISKSILDRLELYHCSAVVLSPSVMSILQGFLNKDNTLPLYTYKNDNYASNDDGYSKRYILRYENKEFHVFADINAVDHYMGFTNSLNPNHYDIIGKTKIMNFDYFMMKLMTGF